MKIRTRYAPSPTGRMHVGNLRTALYAYLISKHEGGDYILRIEDTDQERYVEGATEIIYQTLKDTGLVHDEGPDIGGPVGPYVQSERQKAGIYMQYAKELVDKRLIIVSAMRSVLQLSFRKSMTETAARSRFQFMTSTASTFPKRKLRRTLQRASLS